MSYYGCLGDDWRLAYEAMIPYDTNEHYSRRWSMLRPDDTPTLIILLNAMCRLDDNVRSSTSLICTTV